jgi:N-methylhydantoinase A/oxoprolinase/acetone carboxylase beta subunit
VAGRSAYRQDADHGRQPSAFGVDFGARRHRISDSTGIDLIVHGTTTTTNAVLERRLAKTGMITTRGFRDVIELGRRTRPQALWHDRQLFVPIIPRNLQARSVTERVEASGRGARRRSTRTEHA